MTTTKANTTLALRGSRPIPFYNADNSQEGDFFLTLRGDGLTCGDASKSIPDGSLILCRKCIINHELDIPVDRPVLLKLINTNGATLCIAVITLVDASKSPARVRLSWYNPSYGTKWISVSNIQSIYEIIEKKPLIDSKLIDYRILTREEEATFAEFHDGLNTDIAA